MEIDNLPRIHPASVDIVSRREPRSRNRIVTLCPVGVVHIDERRIDLVLLYEVLNVLCGIDVE
jgi:hypothetical protein